MTPEKQDRIEIALWDIHAYLNNYPFWPFTKIKRMVRDVLKEFS